MKTNRYSGLSKLLFAALSLFLSVSENAYAFPEAANWIKRTTSVVRPDLMKVSDGIFVVNSHYSADGVTWNPSQYPNHRYWINGSGYGAGTFVLTGAVGQIFTSTNFINWTTRNPGGEDITDVVYGGGTFVARKFWSTGDMWVSKNNGVSWTSVDTGDAPDRFYNWMAFGNNKFIYPLDNRVRTSTDGFKWTNHTISGIPSGFLMRFCRHFTGTKFIGAAESARLGSTITISTGTSVDGASWNFKQSTINSTSAGRFYTVGADAGHLLLLSESAPAEVWLSENEGLSWSRINGPWATSGNTGAFFAIKDNMVAVATNKEIYSAPLNSNFDLIDLTVAGGDLQECLSPQGNTVEARITLVPEDLQITSAELFLNGASVATTLVSQVTLPMGTNRLEAVVITTAGHELRSGLTVEIVDTTAPVINARFVDRRTDKELSSVDDNGMTFVIVKIDADDLCDPDPEVDSMLGTAVNDGDALRFIGQIEQLRLNTDKLTLKVMATDASGNVSVQTKHLLVRGKKAR